MSEPPNPWGRVQRIEVDPDIFTDTHIYLAWEVDVARAEVERQHAAQVEALTV